MAFSFGNDKAHDVHNDSSVSGNGKVIIRIRDTTT